MFTKIKQFFCIHYWTCKAEQGIPPPKDSPNDLISFLEYATMYCDKCGKVSDISLKHIEEAKNENSIKRL